MDESEVRLVLPDLGGMGKAQLSLKLGQGSKTSISVIPRQVLDLVIGTSTGGIIAIMLANLQKSIDVQKELSDTLYRLKDLFLPNLFQGPFHVVKQLAIGDQPFGKSCDRGKCFAKNALQTTGQLLETLDHLHGKNIARVNLYHDDLKPENILYVTRKYSQSVLTDSGIPTSLDSPDASLAPLGSTLGYAVPDVTLEEHQGRIADNLFLGCASSRTWCTMKAKLFFLPSKSQHPSKSLFNRGYPLQELGHQLDSWSWSLDSCCETALSHSEASIFPHTKKMVSHSQREKLLARWRTTWCILEMFLERHSRNNSKSYHLVRHRARIRYVWPLDLPTT